MIFFLTVNTSIESPNITGSPTLTSPDPVFSPEQLEIPLETLKMPFEPVMDKFVAATEIQASFSINFQCEYRLIEIDIPELDTAKLLHNAHSHFVDVKKDPRLRQFAAHQTQFKAPEHLVSELDPRRRLNASYKIPQVPLKPAADDDQPWMLLDRSILHASIWYAELSTTYKIMVNQHLAILKTELQAYHMQRKCNPCPYAFDLSVIKQNSLLQQTLVCLNVFVDENGCCQKVG